MTMEQRKAAGIKAAREKAENDRKLGGRAPVKAKKVDGEVNGVGPKGGKEASGGKEGGKEAKEINGVKGGKEVDGVVDGKGT